MKQQLEEEESLDILNSYAVQEAQEIELVDKEENYACNVKEMVCDINDISIEYKRRVVEYWRNGKSRTIKSVKSRFRKVISTEQL